MKEGVPDANRCKSLYACTTHRVQIKPENNSRFISHIVM